MAFLKRLCVPQPRLGVVAGCHPFAVGAERDNGDAVGLRPEGLQLLAGIRLVHLEVTVPSAGEQPLAVGTVRRPPDVALMTSYRELFLPCGSVPDAGRTVVGGSGDPLPIGTEFGAHYRAGVSTQQEGRFTTFQIPH